MGQLEKNKDKQPTSLVFRLETRLEEERDTHSRWLGGLVAKAVSCAQRSRWPPNRRPSNPNGSNFVPLKLARRNLMRCELSHWMAEEEAALVSLWQARPLLLSPSASLASTTWRQSHKNYAHLNSKVSPTRSTNDPWSARMLPDDMQLFGPTSFDEIRWMNHVDEQTQLTNAPR